MADISKININGTDYSIKDSGAIRSHQDISGKANTSGSYSGLSVGYASSAGIASQADHLGDVNSSDRNGVSQTGWYSVGYSNAYDEGHGELAINNYWGIRMNCRDGNHVSVNGYPLITSANIGSQSVNYANSAGSAPANGGTSTYAWKLHRRDASDPYNVQTHWDGSRWVLQGYYEDSYHAPCYVDRSGSSGYADSSGSTGYVHWDNVGGKPASATGVVITSTWSSGASWYRKWSDGWIEQGGIINGGKASGTMAFHIAFSNTNYTITCGATGPDSTGSYPGTGVSPYSNTEFYRVRYYGGLRDCSWYACGY